MPTRLKRPMSALVAVAAGVLLLGGAAVMAQSNISPPTNAGELPVVVTSFVTAAPSPVTGATHSRSVPRSASPPTNSSTKDTPAPVVGRTTARARPTNPTRISPTTTVRTGSAVPAAPAELRLPRLGVTAHVQKVDSVGGVLQVPEDISQVGWWQHSAPAGSAVGNTVIDGHIDSAAAGEGALFHLADLGPGDAVSVTTTNGAIVKYEVDARRVYVKAQGIPASLFDQKGTGKLVIISCGGPFDSAESSYEDNIVIFASPTS